MLFQKKIFGEDALYETPFQLTWRRLNKYRPAMLGLFIILLSVIIAVLGYLITPDSTPNANLMIPEIALQKPGYLQSFLLLNREQLEKRKSFFKKMIYGEPSSYDWIPIVNFRRDNDSVRVEIFRGEGVETKEKIFSISDLAMMDSQNPSKAGTSVLFITKKFWLGTDTYGRDILSRLLIGVRISLAVGFIGVVISLLIGTSLGAMAGYYPGRTDDFIMWLINVVWSIPTLLLVFAITLVLGKGFWQIFVAVGLTMWVQVARIIRGQVMSIRAMEYVEAARSMGYRDSRIIMRHVLPNTAGPVMVVAASNFATAILLEAGLSFLGIGVQPPVPSWGSMIKENYGFLISSNPFLALAPGIAIMIMVLAFNLLGNGLRDALDVKTKTEPL